MVSVSQGAGVLNTALNRWMIVALVLTPGERHLRT